MGVFYTPEKLAELLRSAGLVPAKEPPRTVRCHTRWNLGREAFPPNLKELMFNLPEAAGVDEALGFKQLTGYIKVEGDGGMKCCASDDCRRLYQVVLVDGAGKVQIDTKIVAATEEAAKLAAGVYAYCDKRKVSLDEVTVFVEEWGVVKA